MRNPSCFIISLCLKKSNLLTPTPAGQKSDLYISSFLLNGAVIKNLFDFSSLDGISFTVISSFSNPCLLERYSFIIFSVVFLFTLFMYSHIFFSSPENPFEFCPVPIFYFVLFHCFRLCLFSSFQLGLYYDP